MIQNRYKVKDKLLIKDVEDGSSVELVFFFRTFNAITAFIKKLCFSIADSRFNAFRVDTP